jgi:hypothetical protein
MTDVTDGKPSPWTRDDAALFETEEARCARCGERFVVGQVVQERPAFSLRFYHTTPRDCAKLPEAPEEE